MDKDSYLRLLKQFDSTDTSKKHLHIILEEQIIALGSEMVIVWCYLCRKAVENINDIGRHKGWFICNRVDLEQPLQVKPDSMQRKLSILKENGLIDSKLERSGKGTNRYIKINPKGMKKLALHCQKIARELLKRDEREIQNAKIGGCSGDSRKQRVLLTTGIPFSSYMYLSNKSIKNKELNKSMKTGIPSSANTFIPELEQTDISHQDNVELARKLYKAIRQVKTVSIPAWKPTSKAQCRHLQTIKNSGIQKSQATEIINWYCDNYSKAKELGMPEVGSCSHLRKCWDWIVRVFEQHKAIEVSPDDLPSIEDSITDVMVWLWPTSVKASIPDEVKRTYTTYRKFVRAGYTLLDSLPDKEEHLKFWLETALPQFKSARDFTTQWWEDVFRRCFWNDASRKVKLEYQRYDPFTAENTFKDLLDIGSHSFSRSDVTKLLQRWKGLYDKDS